ADYAATEAVLSFALGIQPRLISNLRLRAQLGVDYFTGLGADFADAVNNERSRAQLWLTVGVALPFGGGTGPSVQTHNDIPAQTPAPDTNAATVAQEIAAPQAVVDADNDGVPDTKDQCPGTPTGAIVDRHGCPLDGDGDGVYDGLDRCPGTAPGLRARVDSFGCPTAEAIPSIPIEEKTVIVTEFPPADSTADEPAAPADTSTAPVEGTDERVEATAPAVVADKPAEPADATNASDTTDATDATDATATTTTTDATDTPAQASDTASAAPNQRPSLSIGSTQVDSDGDGIPDDHDWCPNTLKGLSVDRHGCLIMTQLQRRLILHVSYLPGTTAPDATSLAVLDDLIVRLKREPEVQVTVEGFTDNIGRDDDNLAVSQKRADRIRAYMVRKGIAAARITAIGRGETDFIADNATADGRQKNRRIEISFQRP
ncbi:MAG TPA: OmpA family protein, partial [Acidobacteriota bacterium]|nr:OmpA family protein [Acidobacteriota bacterium]